MRPSNLLRSAILAARRNKKAISMAEINDATDRVIAGTGTAQTDVAPRRMPGRFNGFEVDQLLTHSRSSRLGGTCFGRQFLQEAHRLPRSRPTVGREPQY